MTVVWRSTRRTSVRITVPVSYCGEFADLVSWPRRAAAHGRIAMAAARNRRLLQWRIIAQSPRCPERRQPARRNEFHLDPPVFSVVLPILRRIAENVLVPQLQADFCGDVRQLVHALGRVLPSSGLLGDLRQQTRPREFFRRASAVPS